MGDRIGGQPANGKPGDNPLTDLALYGEHPFPRDIEEMLLEIDSIGRNEGRWPLGENWPFGGREFDWEQGRDLDSAREDLGNMLAMLRAGRGDEVMVHPLTKQPLSES